tara:strand:+ start:177 stop:362 length:186 start_codon:yes stop_codon:yes gene_type:complete
MDNGLAHELSVERSRREIYRCGDIEQLRDVALQLINLVEGQRGMLLQMIDKHEPKLGPVSN